MPKGGGAIFGGNTVILNQNLSLSSDLEKEIETFWGRKLSILTYKLTIIFDHYFLKLRETISLQWGIQDFPWGWGHPVRGRQPLTRVLFGASIWENERIGSRRWEALSRSVNALGLTFNTRPLVQKHVKIILDEWILQTTRPGKCVLFLAIFYFLCKYINDDFLCN